MEQVNWASGQSARTLAIEVRRKKLVSWSNKLSVGVKEIDEQHMTFIDLINQLSDAMYAGRGQTMMNKALTALETYALYHFEAEEKLMIAHNYQETMAHQQGHEQFTLMVRGFRHKFDGSVEVR